MLRHFRTWSALLILATTASAAVAEDNEEDLAKKLSNPVADLISVPFQFNYNGGIGPDEDGEQFFLNFQPVVPIELNEDWNLISRTIVPVTWQDDIFPGAGTQFGLGNTTQSLFFSPSAPVNGIIWGVGPVLYVPTATDDLLGPNKWGAGPTAVGLWQGGGWTVGALANQIWSFAGSDNDPDINATYLQPFVSYSTKDAWTFTLNTESTYNWENDEWSVPINFVVSKIIRVGKLPVSVFGGVRYWAEPQDNGPEGWGGRFGFTLLFPSK